MHSWGFALREGVFAETKEGICRNKDKKRLAVKIQGERELKRRTVSRQAAAWSCELLVSRLRPAKAGPLGAGSVARRRRYLKFIFSLD